MDATLGDSCHSIVSFAYKIVCCYVYARSEENNQFLCQISGISVSLSHDMPITRKDVYYRYHNRVRVVLSVFQIFVFLNPLLLRFPRMIVRMKILWSLRSKSVYWWFFKQRVVKQVFSSEQGKSFLISDLSVASQLSAHCLLSIFEVPNLSLPHSSTGSPNSPYHQQSRRFLHSRASPKPSLFPQRTAARVFHPRDSLDARSALIDPPHRPWHPSSSERCLSLLPQPLLLPAALLSR